jgi:hypothetical protein
MSLVNDDWFATVSYSSNCHLKTQDSLVMQLALIYIFSMDRIENTASNISSVVACVSVAAIT